MKNYIPPELAKKKIARYKYWNIKDESGISITSSEDSEDNRSFAEILDRIINDNVDAEVQVKFGVNEQSSRQNAPIFIRINETIEWVEPEEDESIKINGIPHKVDKNGNVNINLNTPSPEATIVEPKTDVIRQEMELQLEGLRKESELKEQRFQAELHNQLAEQTLKFKEMMLAEREARITEREQSLAQQEAILEEKSAEMGDQLKGYVKLIPSTLGTVVTEWIKSNPFAKTSSTLSGAEASKKEPKPRNKVQFSITDDTISDAVEKEHPIGETENTNPEFMEMEEEFGLEDFDTTIEEKQKSIIENENNPLENNTDENI
ncbi:hypothetical protein [Aquimarina algiphila]|uniref:Uncharacterized protein n=1 Tax=Aquimarina algiphila TaxID=2047982 RepID=A0A554VPD0_9FLAO|nr:hypothetical protein [Aquimarina algiphila]TSE10338.1 hypothetical protein FOF46_04705 [Aquimarina algiphila]